MQGFTYTAPRRSLLGHGGDATNKRSELCPNKPSDSHHELELPGSSNGACSRQTVLYMPRTLKDRNSGAGRTNANDAIHQVIQPELGSKQSFVVRMGRPVTAVSVWIFIIGRGGDKGKRNVGDSGEVGECYGGVPQQ
jgi:hypothetical protein